MNKKGFTLVELLVAATILGILAVFATTSYRNSVAESRWTQARAVTNQLATSLQRVKMDYPTVPLAAEQMGNFDANGCPFDYGTGAFPTIFKASDLVSCGYMELGAWNNNYFNYWVCGTSPTEEFCKKQKNSAYPLACVTVKDTAKLPSQFLENIYCMYETGAAFECRTDGGTETCNDL